MKTRILFCLTGTIVALAIVPGVASAANYCVGSSPLCIGSPAPEFAANESGLNAAMSAANSNSGADTVYIAAGTYPLSSAFFQSFASGQDITIVGAGIGSTVFTSAAANLVQMTFNFDTAASSAGGFTLNLTGAVGAGFGMRVAKGTLHDVEVNESSSADTAFRAFTIASAGTVKRAKASLVSNNSTAVQMVSGDANVNGLDAISTAASSFGFTISGTGATANISRAKISNFTYGIYADGGTMNVSDSLFDLGSTSNAIGAQMINFNNSSSAIASDFLRTTIVGTGSNQQAIRAGADSAGESFNATFKDLVLYGTGSGFKSLNLYGGGTFNLALSDYASNGAESATNVSFPATTGHLSLLSTDPGFVDFAGGDYRLAWNSPLVDAGDPSTVVPVSATDLRDKPRVVDGNGNGTAAVDFGANEYQRTPPVVTATAAKPFASIGEPVSFSAAATDAEGEAITYSWNFNDGTTAAGASPIHAFASVGAYVATVTATDVAGVSASAQTVVTVSAAESPTAKKPTAKVTRKPKKAFKRGKRGFKIVKSGSRTFSVKFTDSAKAKFKLKSIGKKKRLKSVKGSQTLRVKNGTNKVTFAGKFGSKKLKPGMYRVTITPLSSQGISGKSVTVTIKLVK